MNTIYVILAAKKTDYRNFAKKGCKIEGMSYRTSCSPIYSEADKSTALADCRRLNRGDHTMEMTYYPLELKLYT